MLLLGMVIAGLAQVLIPRELIACWLGKEAGVDPLRGDLCLPPVAGLLAHAATKVLA